MSDSRVLGKRRGRSWDAEIDDTLNAGKFYSKFRPMTILVPHKMYAGLGFLRHRDVDGHRISAVVPCLVGSLPLYHGPLDGTAKVVFDFDVYLENDTVIRDVLTTWVGNDSWIQRIFACLPLCTTFLMGMLPRMGRNELVWIEVDEDTRKRVRSPPDSYVHRAFVQHTLGERQLVREIFSFLC